MYLAVQGPAPLSADILGQLAQALGAGLPRRDSDCMATFPLGPGAGPKDVLHAACQRLGLDSAILAPPRRLSDFKLLVFDMDSTLIDVECIDELADLVGKKREVAALTGQAMQSGKVDYDASLRLRTRLLAGLAVERFARLYDERVHFSPGARALVDAARRAGLRTAIVSGGFDYFAGRVRQALGIDAAYCNRLAVRDGRLTGELEGELINAEAKARRVARLCQEMGVPTRDAIVVGDGANDLGMMALAGLAVGFRPKPVLRASLDVVLDHLGLDALLNVVRPG